MNIKLEAEIEENMTLKDVYYPFALIIKMKFKTRQARTYALKQLEKTIKNLMGMKNASN